MMMRNRICWALLLLTAALTFIFSNSYISLLLLLAVIVIPLLSLALLLASRQVGLTLRLPETMEKERDTSFSYVIENRSRLPAARVAWRVRVDNQLTFAHREMQTSASVGGRRSREIRFTLTQPRTGTTVVSTDALRLEDAFGIFCLRLPDLPDGITVVYPTLREVAIYFDVPVETLGDGRRWSPDRKGGDISEIFGMHEYVPGDEIRRIHWKMSSKVDQMVVRDFSLPLNFSVFLLLELSRASEEVMDRALEIYSSASRVLMEKGVNHNLAWFDGSKEELQVYELTDVEDLEVALAQLLASYAYEEETPALEHYAGSVYCDPRSTLLYVTTHPNEDRVAEVAVRQTVRVIDASQEDTETEIWV
ncbi:MAG: DUF58 domain-containing protein [Anaerovoracaceae bacterium]|jgi:uncharacterized protein (DUF58 family)